MDKFEYKIKADEIKELIAQKEYEQAAEIADSIDWRRVKSVMMLCTVSDLYKMCRRYEDSRDMLLLAYERHPGGRTILYSLCELSIKMEEFVQAVEYYKEYIQIAPRDTGRYILQYKLYEAQDVSLEERIAVLEELKKRDYREKWAYELAYLYHRVGLATKCVEECDELILWFGAGKYVIKALELKKLHAPLTPEQQYKYDQRFHDEETGKAAVKEADTGNAVTGSMQKDAIVSTDGTQKTEAWDTSAAGTPVKEMDIQVKTFDVGKYDTINLQEELAAGIQEYFGSANEDSMTRSIVAPLMSTTTIDLSETMQRVNEKAVEAVQEAAKEEPRSEVFFGETGEISEMEQGMLPLEEMSIKKAAGEASVEDAADKAAPENAVKENRILYAQPPKEMANVLSMEADGQISFVLPEREPVEKQITGQISINDIILEWERLKKENEEKRKEEVRQRVLLQTGTLFTEFDAAVRDGLLEQLERDRSVQEMTREEELAELFEDKTEEAVEEFRKTDMVSEEAADTDTEDVDEVTLVDITGDIGEVEELTEIADVTEADETVDESVIAELPPEEDEESVEEIEEVVKNFEEFVNVEVAEQSVEEFSEFEEAEADETNDTEVCEPEVIGVEFDETEEEQSGDTAETEAVLEKRKVRNLTKEERELYGPYIQGRSSKEQLIQAIDGISMAAYTGNLIVTGDEGMNSLGLAKNIIREIQMADSNFSGKIAKISGKSLNTRDVKQIIDNLDNGALIIQKASLIRPETADSLYKALQQENKGIVVVLEDTKKQMNRFLDKNEKLLQCFTSRVDIAALSDDALVSFARKYAREKEYSIDEMGLLALHTRIADMQTSDHAVTILEVKEIMDEAIESANRKTIGHFFDIIFARRYDDEDMIILKEKDFI